MRDGHIISDIFMNTEQYAVAKCMDKSCFHYFKFLHLVKTPARVYPLSLCIMKSLHFACTSVTEFFHTGQTLSGSACYDFDRQVGRSD